ncbi:hypothetical protein Poly21_02500 [Allorhodopirellula heiligendammensis]|uniref:Trypsin-like peptidase domain-containing protein n=2 Tax=Allorhodopirellula heiligendammensis TaxID=2714739 RepID=A0A5C6C1Y1_9BACT|nr:hypothetical protein Poly21_02500 [Allorhodopirellula heiligendammensis]
MGIQRRWRQSKSLLPGPLDAGADAHESSQWVAGMPLPVSDRPVALKTKNRIQARPYAARNSGPGFSRTGAAPNNPGRRSAPQTSVRKWFLIGFSSVAIVSLLVLMSQPLPVPSDEETWTQSSGDVASAQIPQNAPPESPAKLVPEVSPLIVENEIPANFLFWPVIETAIGKTSGGLVFAAYKHDPDTPVLLGNLSRLGPTGGLDKQIDALDVFASWHSVSLFDPLTRRARGVCTSRPKIIPGARPFPATSPHGDVFAIGNLPTKRLNALPLATENPSVDDQAWVILPVQDQGFRVVSCRIADFDHNWMSFVLDDTATHNLTGKLQWAELADDKSQLDIGGAPLVNAAAEVIGVVSALRHNDDRWTGQASLTAYFQDYL